jgi:hypothetical protein
MSLRDLIEKLLKPEAVREIKRYLKDVEAGEDPIEALHGHLCDSDCWHYQLGDAKTRDRIDKLARARKARGP